MRLIIEANQTEELRHLAINICRDFGLLDVDVCVGAVDEYGVNYFLSSKLFDIRCSPVK
jgi:hypothetical protein